MPISKEEVEQIKQKKPERIRVWRSLGKDVYLYFDNDPKGYAPANAETLKNLLRGGGPGSRKNARKTPEKQG